MKIRWSSLAISNLQELSEYIGQDSPDRSAILVSDLVKKVDLLEHFPRRGRVVPELGGRYREILAAPFRIIYRLEREITIIVTVVHGARDLTRLPLS